MPVPLLHRRDISANRLALTFGAAELFFDNTTKRLFIGDGSSQPGGLQVDVPPASAVAGTTYAIAAGDTGKLLYFTNAGGCAITLNQANSASGTYFPNQTGIWLLNLSGGNLTVTPTTSTINNGSTFSVGANQSAFIVSDGTNYWAVASASGFSSTEDEFAIGNTTGLSSSSTFPISNQTISGAGAVSVGYSTTAAGSGVLIISAPPSPGTVADQFALGNTTGATSSVTNTLTNSSVSGAGAVSVGFSTTAAGANVLIISSPTQSVQTLGMTATGGTTGATSSETQDARSLTLSFGGAISGGFSNGSLLFSVPTGAGFTTNDQQFALGNTTGATSSTTGTLTQMSVSGAGNISVGFSTTAAGAGVMIISGASGASGTSFSNHALGNTTGATSSTTLTLTDWSVSGAGGVSVGYSTTAAGAGVVIISGATTAASGTSDQQFALGNTTGATSSTTGTLTQLSLSGAGGASVGFSTTAAGAGVIIISAATAAASATSMGLTAAGNTTGSTSSMTNALTAETISGAGGVSVGFSNGSIIISGPPAASAVSQEYYELQPNGPAGSITNGLSVFSNGSALAFTIAPPLTVTFNQLMFLASMSSSSGTLSVATTGGASTTLTASGSWGYTYTFGNFTKSGGTNYTQFNSAATTTFSIGVSESHSISITGASISHSDSISFLYAAGSARQTDTYSSTSSVSTAVSFTYNPAATGGASSSYVSLVGLQAPWATTINSGLQMMALLSVTGSQTGGGSVTATMQSWSHSLIGYILVSSGFGNPSPGHGNGANRLWSGNGVTSSAGSVFPTNIIMTGLSSFLTGAGGAHVQPAFTMGVF